MTAILLAIATLHPVAQVVCAIGLLICVVIGFAAAVTVAVLFFLSL